VWQTDGNVLSTSAYQRGDVDAALGASSHVISETFHTQRIEHAFLEPEATLAIPSVDSSRRVKVYSGGQGIWDDRNDIARVLGIDNSQVTVELVTNGGAFGGKEDMSNQAHTALAAWLIDAPVKCVLSREESFLMHAKRHPIRMHYEMGCDDHGMLTALRVRAVGDSGAYASVGMKVLERMAGHMPVARTTCRRSMSKQSPFVRTIPLVEPSAGSARIRPSSPWKACSIGSLHASASADGKFVIET
jgi:xanthine dehydrogenase molybdenum-binding subunit